jgi:hypothetical protein
MGDEIKLTVVQSLVFADGYVPRLTQLVLPADGSHGARSQQVARALYKKMRTTLPVPAIFAALKVLRRLHTFACLSAEAHEEGARAKLPASGGHVDHTVKRIFRDWERAVTAYETLRDTEHFEVGESNPWVALANTLHDVIEHNTRVFFGVSFFEDEE